MTPVISMNKQLFAQWSNSVLTFYRLMSEKRLAILWLSLALPPKSLSFDVRYRAGYYLSGAHFLVPTLCHCGRSASDGIDCVRELILMICLVRESEWRVELRKDKQAWSTIGQFWEQRDQKKERAHYSDRENKAANGMLVSKQWDCAVSWRISLSLSFILSSSAPLSFTLSLIHVFST